MALQFKAELRKIDGLRFVRFKALSRIDSDSVEELKLSAAITECNIADDDRTGLYRRFVQAEDGTSVSVIGGVDIPAVSIELFTAALTRQGFKVV